MLQGQILRFVYNYISTSLPYIKILLILSHNCFKYSGTSPYGHLFNTDTSLIRTVHLVPERPKTDTSIMRTLIPVPLVSVIKRFDCSKNSNFFLNKKKKEKWVHKNACKPTVRHPTAMPLWL